VQQEEQQNTYLNGSANGNSASSDEQQHRTNDAAHGNGNGNASNSLDVDDAEVSNVNKEALASSIDADRTNDASRSLSLSPINLNSAHATFSIVMPVQFIVYDSTAATPSASPSPTPTHRQRSESPMQPSPQQSSRAVSPKSVNSIVSMTHGLLYATESHLLYEPCAVFSWCHRMDYDYEENDSLHKDVLSPIHTIMSPAQGHRSSAVGSNEAHYTNSNSPMRTHNTPYNRGQHARWRIPVFHISHSHDTDKALKLKIRDPSNDTDASPVRVTITSFAPYITRLRAYIDERKSTPMPVSRQVARLISRALQQQL